MGGLKRGKASVEGCRQEVGDTQQGRTPYAKFGTPIDRRDEEKERREKGERGGLIRSPTEKEGVRQAARNHHISKIELHQHIEIVRYLFGYRISHS